MTWAVYFVLGYVVAAAWIATAIWFYTTDDAGSRNNARRACWQGLCAMWILPALLIAYVLFAPKRGER